MDVQVLANFSHLIDRYKKAKMANNARVQALDGSTCSLNVKVFNEQNGEAEWRFLGNIPVDAIDEVRAAKETEIADLDALKSEMEGVLAKVEEE